MLLRGGCGINVSESSQERAFIYIAALRRSGSTVLAEALTSLPYSFIFREPPLGRDRINFKESEIVELAEHEIDLKTFT